MKRPLAHASGLAQALAAAPGACDARRSGTVSRDDMVAESRLASAMTDEEAAAMASAWLLALMPPASTAIH